jgi:SAM-dependent methyltransferase
MNSGFHRLHQLRMENDAKGYEMDEMRERFDRIANRHENGTAPRAVSAFNLFQTPEPLAERLVSLLDIRPGDRVLEPSAGLGRLLVEINKREPAQVSAVEIAQDCARELFREFPDLHRLYQRDFLEMDPSETGLFDRIAMNPPFKMRRDIAHIRHALDFLAPGGTLAALCLSTNHRADAFRCMAETWEIIPAGTFRGEGTGVETILFTVKKP